MGTHYAIDINLTDTDIAALKQGETVAIRGRAQYGVFRLRMLRESELSDWDTAKWDPAVDLVIDPHDLWDLQVDGGLLVDYRDRDVLLHAEALGFDAAPAAEWPPEKPAKGKGRKRR